MTDDIPASQTEWLRDQALMAVLEALDGANGQARIVGGAVRNSLLGLPVADVDIATVWQPENVIERIENAGMKAVKTGIAHGTVTAISNRIPFEITTLRVDLTGDGRHAEIAFTKDWAEDASRRDFTINALYLNSDGTLFDPLGGRKDIEGRRVRFIGDANDRIREDYLRILRFFRFHAQFASGEIDREGLVACIRGRIGVWQLSAERVRTELLRLLSVEQAAETVELFSQTGILTDLLGGVAYVANLRKLEKIERDYSWQLDPLLRLAVLGCKIPEDAIRLSERLHLSKKEAKRIASAVKDYCRLSPEMDEPARRHLLYRFGPRAYWDRVLFAWANAGGKFQPEQWAALHSFPDQWTAPNFPINAAMVMAHGIEPGERVGVLMRAAEEVWIEAGYPVQEADIKQILSTVVLQD